MNIFTVVVFNTIFNYFVFKIYCIKKESDEIEKLSNRIEELEKQLLEKNKFIANELQNELKTNF